MAYNKRQIFYNEMPMAEKNSYHPDSFKAFVVLFRYSESQAHLEPGEPLADYDPDAMIAALRKLYNTDPEQRPQYWNAPKLLAGLEQILAQTGQESLLGTLEVRENLQIVGLLLDAILADPAVPDGIAPFFTSLQFPLLIASFADPALLDAPNHPARELLNQLAHLSLATSVQGSIDNPELLHSLEQAMGIISIDSADTQGVFAEALDALSTLTKPLLKSFAMRLERVIETCRGGYRLNQARSLVGREIAARLGGKAVPKILMDLLAGGWQQLLVLTCLRQGIDADGWEEELALLDLLIATASKDDAPAPLGQSRISELKNFILQRLYSVGSEPTTANHLADAIENLLLRDAGKSPPEYVTVPPADTDREARESIMRTRLQGFRAGDWLLFASTRNAWMPLRLTWIGPDPPRYVFVNQKGIKSMDLDAEEFVRILDEKRAKRIASLEQQPLVERAAKSLLHTLRDRIR